MKECMFMLQVGDGDDTICQSCPVNSWSQSVADGNHSLHADDTISLTQLMQQLLQWVWHLVIEVFVSK